MRPIGGGDGGQGAEMECKEALIIGDHMVHAALVDPAVPERPMTCLIQDDSCGVSAARLGGSETGSETRPTAPSPGESSNASFPVLQSSRGSRGLALRLQWPPWLKPSSPEWLQSWVVSEWWLKFLRRRKEEFRYDY